MTREIPLTKGFVALVDDEDFERVSAFSWLARISQNSVVYASRRRRVSEKPGGMMIWLHRFILGTAPGIIVDHRNSDGLDCQRANLRECDARGNTRNRRPIRGKAIKGAYRNRQGRYGARIRIDDSFIHLGTFDTEIEAGLAYDTAARRLFGEFAYLNFPSMAA